MSSTARSSQFELLLQAALESILHLGRNELNTASGLSIPWYTPVAESETIHWNCVHAKQDDIAMTIKIGINIALDTVKCQFCSSSGVATFSHFLRMGAKDPQTFRKWAADIDLHKKVFFLIFSNCALPTVKADWWTFKTENIRPASLSEDILWFCMNRSGCYSFEISFLYTYCQQHISISKILKPKTFRHFFQTSPPWAFW